MPPAIAIAGVVGDESVERDQWKLLSENLDGRRISGLFNYCVSSGLIWGQLAARLASFRVLLLCWSLCGSDT